MKLHILTLPFTETTDAWPACAYTQRTKDFTSFMTDAGYETILYGGTRNQARVTQHVVVHTPTDRQRWFPDTTPDKMFTGSWDAASPGWAEYNMRAAAMIGRRSSKGDVLCVTMGTSHQPVAAALPDLYHVETGVGYHGVWAPFRIYESLAWRHFLAGKQPNDEFRPLDDVIPRGYFSSEFPAAATVRKDFLYLGRLIKNKGVRLAAQACALAGVRLLVAGQGMASTEPGRITCEDGTVLEGDVQYLGVLSPSERAFLLSTVRAVFVPTIYLEPGGGVAIEAQLCGTPVITVPYGAMSETVLPGTGFHCQTLAEFVAAIPLVDYLSSEFIRKSAVRRFDASVVAAKYDRYFKRLQTEGWAS